jgi:acyl-CoA thioesterase-1
MSRFVYVALGDSTGVGYGAPRGAGYVDRLRARLVQNRSDVELVNLAASGATARDVLVYQTRALRRRPLGSLSASAQKPDLVTLFVGSNDVWRGGSVDTFAHTMDAIGQELARSGAPVVVSDIGDLSHAPAAGFAEHLVGLTRAMVRQRILDMNAEIHRVAKKHQLTLVRLFEATQVTLPAHPEFFCPDGFHPSSAGYQALAETMWGGVERAALAGS